MRSLTMAAARKSTSARCAAGSLRHTPDSNVSRARATAASTAAWSESTTSAICSSVDGLKTGMMPELRLSTAGSVSMALLNVLHPFAEPLRDGEARCLQSLRTRLCGLCRLPGIAGSPPLAVAACVRIRA